MSDKHTVRFPHLFEESSLKPGDRVRYGDLIGHMGSTGTSSFQHIHLDAIRGLFVKGCWRAKQIISGQFQLDIDFIMRFLCYDLLRGPMVLSYFVDDPRYVVDVERVLHYTPDQHKGIDILDFWSRKNPGIFWPFKDLDGICLSNYFDGSAYGWAVHIGAEY